jgi:hypothetical protein
MSKSKLMNVAVNSIVTTGNVRFPLGADIITLADDIRENGLQTRIEVRDLNDGTFEALRGHRRLAAWKMILETAPDFGDSIPAVVWSGMSDVEAMLHKVDQGNTRGLSMGETELACHLLMSAGVTKERDLIIRLAGLFESLSPMKGGQLAKYNEAQTAGDKKKCDDIVFAYRRGLIAPMIDTFYLPKMVSATRYFLGCGQWPEGYEPTGDEPKKLGNADVRELKKAFDADCATRDEDGVPVYDAENIGPAFTKAWQEVINKPESVTVKSLCLKEAEIKALIEKGTVGNSYGCLLITYIVEGGLDGAKLKEFLRLNKDLRSLDALRKGASSEYHAAVALGVDVAKQLVEASK